MHAGGIVLTVDRPAATSDYVASLRRRDRAFWLSLAVALSAHVLILLIMLMGNSAARTLGTPDGANDAIAVEIVDAATLKDSMEPPTPATTPPGSQQQTAALSEQQPPQPQQPPPEPQVEPTPPAEAAAPPPTPEAAPPVPEAAPPAQAPKTPDPAPKLSAPDLPAFEEAPTAEQLAQPPPQEAPKQEVPKEAPKETQKAEPPKQPTKQPQKQQQAKQPPQKRTQTSALDLSVPYDGAPADSDAGSSSAVQRPPGITRSGENDEFARNVIRALQKTMPREGGRGRVTVRIVLNENASRADVKLMQSGGNSDLDFNVMFAARSTPYPFPPKKSTLVDRTFTVTYIYR